MAQLHNARNEEHVGLSVHMAMNLKTKCRRMYITISTTLRT